MSSEKLEKLKISDQAFENNSVEKMSTIPSRPSAFGASALTPEQVKKRFDANPNLIRTKLNELLDMLPGIAGELKVTVNLSGEMKEINLAELVASFYDTTGALQIQNILKVTYGGEDKTIKEIVATLTKGLSDAQDRLNLRVDKMSVIDEKRIKAYEEDGGYYFSENNWKAFIGDEASGKFGYNRAYVERSKGRGTYGMYALSPDANPIYNAWYSKSEWDERFTEEHPGETFREPYDDEYPRLDSIAQRSNTGHLSVPLNPTDNEHAVPLEYVIKLHDKFNGVIKKLTDEFNSAREEFNSNIEEYNQMLIEMRNDVYAGTPGLAYELSHDGTSYISTGLGEVPENSDVEIAAYIDGLPVTEVAESAFQNKVFEGVHIPATITKFGKNAFGWGGKTNRVYIKDIAKWCEITFEVSASPVTAAHPKIYIKGLYKEHLEIPEGVTNIPQRCFMNWIQFKSVTLPQTLTTIKSMGLQYCTGLESVTIPSSVINIEASAFGYCSELKTVTFEGKPSGTITARAFEQCPNLTDIYVPWSEGEVANAPWGATNATVHYNCYGTAGLSYTLSDDGTYYLCSGIGTATDKNIVIASAYKGLPVTSIGASAFYNCSMRIKSVVIPKSVTSIGSSAFRGCVSLSEVINNSSLNIVAGSSDYGCVALYVIEVHTGESKIVNKDDYLFYTYNGANYLLGYDGEDTVLTLPENYNGKNYEIYKYAFYGRKEITDIVMSDGITGICAQAFRGTSLTSVTIPDSVTSIENWVFLSCSSLESIVIGDGIESIGNEAFWQIYNLKNIYVPWSEGEVANAPWGATNATIHYNSEV